MRPRFITDSQSEDGPGVSPGTNPKARRKPTPENAPHLDEHPWGRDLKAHEKAKRQGEGIAGPVPSHLGRGKNGVARSTRRLCPFCGYPMDPLCINIHCRDESRFVVSRGRDL